MNKRSNPVDVVESHISLRSYLSGNQDKADNVREVPITLDQYMSDKGVAVDNSDNGDNPDTIDILEKGDMWLKDGTRVHFDPERLKAINHRFSTETGQWYANEYYLFQFYCIGTSYAVSYKTYGLGYMINKSGQIRHFVAEWFVSGNLFNGVETDNWQEAANMFQKAVLSHRTV